VIAIFEQAPEGPVGYGFEDFQNRFLDICADHRASSRALAFAFLLFDIDTPEFMKMLRDPEYWDALHQISGRYLTVFALMADQPQYPYDREYRSMVHVGAVSDPGKKVQLILKSYFGLDVRALLPAVMFFQVDEDRVSGYSFVQLGSNTVESAFNEIRHLLRDIADVLAKAESSSPQDGEVLFGAIKNRLRKRKAVHFVKDGKKVLASVKEIATLARMIGLGA
jgi:hypothetical protein